MIGHITTKATCIHSMSSIIVASIDCFYIAIISCVMYHYPLWVIDLVCEYCLTL